MRAKVDIHELAEFRSCRRAWDLGSPNRGNLEPLAGTNGPDVADAVRRALAVYYFPGMWDWDRPMVEGLTRADLRRWLPDGSDELAQAERVIDAYVASAPSLDRFAPIRVASAYEAPVVHPSNPDAGILDARERPVDYIGEVDLLVTDEADRYWVMRHRIGTGAWVGERHLALDERDLADCWGMQDAYLGLEVTGTITNELRLDVDAASEARGPGDVAHVPQNEPSGGGRSIPHHRRAAVRDLAASDDILVEERGPVRRTWIARSTAEIAAIGRRIGMVVSDMVAPDLEVYPTPSSRHCPDCAFLDPCIEMTRGASAQAMLDTRYRERGRRGAEPGRLGGVSWGMGRGAVPPERWSARNPGGGGRP